MDTYETKVRQATYSPFLERMLHPGERLSLAPDIAEQCCDRQETVEYPVAQAADMERQGFKVNTEERSVPDSAGAEADLRERGYVVHGGKYRVAVGTRKVRGILRKVSAAKPPQQKPKAGGSEKK